MAALSRLKRNLQNLKNLFKAWQAAMFRHKTAVILGCTATP